MRKDQENRAEIAQGPQGLSIVGRPMVLSNGLRAVSEQSCRKTSVPVFFKFGNPMNVNHTCQSVLLIAQIKNKTHAGGLVVTVICQTVICQTVLF
jgi:hypothetical protein